MPPEEEEYVCTARYCSYCSQKTMSHKTSEIGSEVFEASKAGTTFAEFLQSIRELEEKKKKLVQIWNSKYDRLRPPQVGPPVKKDN